MNETGADRPEVVDAEIVEDDPSPATPGLEPDYTEAGVPTFDYVRDRIEKRFHTSAGETELAGLGTDHTIASVDEQLEKRDKAAKEKLDEIRRSMRGD